MMIGNNDFLVSNLWNVDGLVGHCHLTKIDLTHVNQRKSNKKNKDPGKIK